MKPLCELKPQVALAVVRFKAVVLFMFIQCLLLLSLFVGGGLHLSPVFVCSTLCRF